MVLTSPEQEYRKTTSMTTTELPKRSGIVDEVTLIGHPVQVGEQAPEFKATDEAGRDVSLSSLRGRTIVLSIFPSINTAVCQLQTKSFNKRASELGESILIVSVAHDEEADFTKFCATNGIENLLNLSDIAYGEFGDKYGFGMEGSDWLARGVVVIDPEGKITHVEYVKALAEEPDYEAALAAAKATVGEDQFVQLPLPYAHDALEPIMSKETIGYHYGKHLAAYVANLNRLTKGTEWEGKSLIEIVKGSEGPIFNNAGQVYNHRIFFNTFSAPDVAQKAPTGDLAALIDAEWGSFEKFQEAFEAAGMAVFGSGWVWLSVGEDGKLLISTSANGDSPLTKNNTPILGIDVWEHSYYLDYFNMRAEYLKKQWSIIDWKKVELSHCRAK